MGSTWLFPIAANTISSKWIWPSRCTAFYSKDVIAVPVQGPAIWSNILTLSPSDQDKIRQWCSSASFIHGSFQQFTFWHLLANSCPFWKKNEESIGSIFASSNICQDLQVCAFSLTASARRQHRIPRTPCARNLPLWWMRSTCSSKEFSVQASTLDQGMNLGRIYSGCHSQWSIQFQIPWAFPSNVLPWNVLNLEARPSLGFHHASSIRVHLCIKWCVNCAKRPRNILRHLPAASNKPPRSWASTWPKNSEVIWPIWPLYPEAAQRWVSLECTASLENFVVKQGSHSFRRSESASCSYDTGHWTSEWCHKWYTISDDRKLKLPNLNQINILSQCWVWKINMVLHLHQNMPRSWVSRCNPETPACFCNTLTLVISSHNESATIACSLQNDKWYEDIFDWTWHKWLKKKNIFW